MLIFKALTFQIDIYRLLEIANMIHVYQHFFQLFQKGADDT